MKKILLAFIVALTSGAAFGQAIPQEKMEWIYQQSRTPYKFGLVVAPDNNYKKYDCPTVFRKDGKWLMTFVCYNGKDGNDGRGYETWLAESDDLLHWDIKGRVLEYPASPQLPPTGKGRGGAELWDQNQRGGFPALIDYDWGGTYEMKSYKGQHYMTYIGGAGRGYEAVEQPLSIGIATTDKDIATAHPWKTYDKPLISYNDKDAQWWEYMTQYKSTIYQMDKKWFGYPFVMFYNAGGKDETHPKGERIGIALSKDMKRWKRYAGNPVFAHDSDGTITGDAQIVWMPLTPSLSLKGEGVEEIVPSAKETGSNSNNKSPSPFRERDGVRGIWVMYYFSAFNPTREYNAYNTFAASTDLIHWQDWTGDDLIIPSKPYDEMFAHKSYLVKWNGTVYHFYCAVNNSGQRGIAVATSKPMGKSEVNFPTPEPTGKRYTQNLTAAGKEGNWKIEVLRKDSSSYDNGNQVLRSGESMKGGLVNLDDYYGTFQGEHGNLHGEALFSKTFTVPDLKDKAYFLRFEGVGTYAEVTLNGVNLGRYAIGRTCETIEATKAIKPGKENLLEVKVSHPSGITDMPWVCGGCSSEWGFSEGSQPFGIYRPVVLEATDPVRIEPFGTHIWHNESLDSVFVDTEVKNYSDATVTFQLVSKIADKSGKQFARITDEVTLAAGEAKTIRQQTAVKDPVLWTLEKPYLYTLQSMIKRNGKATDDYPVQFGFRTASWPLSENRKPITDNRKPTTENRLSTIDNRQSATDNTFHLNGAPVYINGVCEYEHLYGQSHAFYNEQIDARIKEVKMAGFNAFRDAHQPHNLHYGDLIQQEGLLWWPQFSAHIWYDTPQFRESFKRHLVQWVKERRNNPAVVLWGLQNESTLPKDFAEECSEIIRSMDPYCGRSRLITTCNGGEGTDWNVVQNWSGTYGGDVNKYGEELKRPDQLLNGEYGAWRTLGNHSGQGYSEEKQADLLEKKCQQAESVKDSICGQFLWLLGSHDNPGRRQPDEAFRRVDKVGPFNYKGLFTPWEQPVSSFYMYKSRYTPVEKEPVCYIVRDIYQGIKPKNGVIDSLRVYSNCPEVRLVADGKAVATMQKPKNSTLYVFRNITVGEAHLLRAEGDGVYDEVCTGQREEGRGKSAESASKPMLRINCGGDAVGDWKQDSPSYSTAWRLHQASDSIIMPVASQTCDLTLPVPEIFRTSRFGRHDLMYAFSVEKGKTYDIELSFIEPWYGASRSEKTDCEGLRVFDVAIDDVVVLNDLDIWAQAGYGKPYTRKFLYTAQNDILKIHFPEVKAGQAIISGISISPEAGSVVPQGFEYSLKEDFWASQNTDTIVKMPDHLLPPKQSSALSVEPVIDSKSKTIQWTYSVGVAKVYALRFRYWNGEKPRTLHVTVKDKNGVTYVDSDVAFLQTQEKKTKRKMSSITTGSQTNAGTYTVTLSGEGLDEMIFENLTIE